MHDYMSFANGQLHLFFPPFLPSLPLILNGQDLPSPLTFRSSPSDIRSHYPVWNAIVRIYSIHNRGPLRTKSLRTPLCMRRRFFFSSYPGNPFPQLLLLSLGRELCEMVSLPSFSDPRISSGRGFFRLLAPSLPLSDGVFVLRGRIHTISPSCVLEGASRFPFCCRPSSLLEELSLV